MCKCRPGGGYCEICSNERCTKDYSLEEPIINLTEAIKEYNEDSDDEEYNNE